MAFFPLFIDLTGRNCLVVGAGPVAVRKIQHLLDFNATVRVVSPEAEPEIHTWAAQGWLTYLPREYCAADLSGAFMVIAATSDRGVNEAVCQEASAQGLWVNVADHHPGEGNFGFPALVRREQLVIGISTSGSFPALSKRLRVKLENQLAAEWGPLFIELERIRTWVKQTVPDRQKRRELLQQLAEEVLEQFME